jgi:hypothetical protein
VWGKYINGRPNKPDVESAAAVVVDGFVVKALLVKLNATLAVAVRR